MADQPKEPWPWLPMDNSSSEVAYWRDNALSCADDAAEEWGIETLWWRPTAWRAGYGGTECDVYEFRCPTLIVKVLMEYDGAPDAKQKSKCVEIRFRGLS